MTGVGAALAIGGLTLILSLVLPFAVKPLLMRLGIMDVPNERSSHERPVLRGLGLAVLIAMLVGGATAVALVRLSPGYGYIETTLLIVVLGSAAAGLLGLAEDLRGLSVAVRSLCLLIIACGVSVSLLFQSALYGDIAGYTAPVLVQWVAGWPLAGMPVWALVLLVVYAILFISSYINVANFMDGLNGISGLHGSIAGLAFAAAGLLSGQGWLLVAGLVLAAGFLGFLPWNLTRPGAFLGDVGSYLLGGAVAVTSFAALVSGVPFLATIGPMVIYFGDVGVTLVKRVRAGKRWDEPHKEHTYQRIQQLGYSHVQASAMAAGCTLLTSILGLVSMFTGLFGTLALLVGGLAVLAFYLALPRLLPTRAS
ncbi:UDP-phosphate alpha-N-acetyl-D-fucosaminephosphotransferase [Leucobacter ruminantium]|uniref:UDP-phosphate alpha-N-acetyl-D-fucosaminephosphotransferase n=1 Tax=Leucobacter ruminantium TaxID=1289170 RepID=A0A939RYH9_9MICO|nr:UDP-phosphate alpha-N-acetyl-D-fucosaminephosphotransferase [Leucobacter ruminantium]MBO1804891.1 UDP-phosphate alpha-N-acetyl-D-fucosaminephosphotransferase [Leucobacter ruminantium]